MLHLEVGDSRRRVGSSSLAPCEKAMGKLEIFTPSCAIGNQEEFQENFDANETEAHLSGYRVRMQEA